MNTDIKIAFDGNECTEIDGELDIAALKQSMTEEDKNRIVFCQGCFQKVKYHDSKFVLWGGEHCFFCNTCLSAINKATQDGKPIMTHDELMEARKNA